MKTFTITLAALILLFLVLGLGLERQQQQIEHLRAANRGLVNQITAYDVSMVVFVLPDGKTFLLTDPDDQCNDSDTPVTVRNSDYCN